MPRLEDAVKEFAKTLGFSLVGIAPATEADGFDRLREWLDRGYAGEMGYMARQAEARRRPDSILPNVRSVVMVAMDYAEPAASGVGLTQRLGVSATRHAAENFGKVSRYAAGADYHHVMWRRLDKLLCWLEAEAPGCRGRGVVDTAPLLERDFARRAGLGWIGKNTMLINKERGSYFFLGALLTDLELQPDQPHEAEHCGSCTACLDACPTQAFPEPGLLDARRCIAYLTIELRGSIPQEQRAGIGDWLFGCDVCQEVCPWNHPDHSVPTTVNAIEILEMDDATYRERFRDTAMSRAKRAGLRRNAAVVLGNAGDESAVLALTKALQDDEAGVRDAAAWAIEQINTRRTLDL